MPTQIVLQATGPLPLTVHFQPPVGAPPRLEVTFVVYGSAFSAAESQMIGVRATDTAGATVASASLFANAALMHLALVPASFRRVTPAGQIQEFELAPLTEATVTNADDNFLVMAHY